MLLVQLNDPRRQLLYCFFGEQDPPKALFQHRPDKTKLVPSQQLFIKQVLMELNGNFPDLFAFAVMGKPGMLQVRAYQYEFQLINFFNMVAYDAFGAPAVLYEIQ